MRKILIIGNPGDGIVLKARELHAALRPADEQTVFEQKLMAAGCSLPESNAVPFRAPHHTVSSAGLNGGGERNRPRPGEVSLAHGGTLFLDEVKEFRRSSTEVLYSILEKGSSDLRWSIAGATVRYPARPQLVIASFPKCYYFLNLWSTAKGAAKCTSTQCSCNDENKAHHRELLADLIMDFQPDEIITLEPFGT
jgi:magnesium chelatase family protein